MSAPARHPDVWDVVIALVFIGAPMVMIGVELLTPRTG